LRIAIVVFPGTNCEEETHYVLGSLFDQQVERVWHQDTDLTGFDAVVLPGGFAYGDHLRAGAIARFSPIMRSVADLAERGGLVVGICNGFQVLCEAGLLPGTLLPNGGRSFLSTWVHCRVESHMTAATADVSLGTVLRLPIAHGEGRYFADRATLASLERNGQVVLRYCAPDGTLSDEANPNSSVDHIAGICNEAGNVFGLMPHPERAAEPELPSADGRLLIGSLVAHAGMNSPISAPLPRTRERGSLIGAASYGFGADSVRTVDEKGVTA
jgi:phosphoribosylformylglycinamidine synthase